MLNISAKDTKQGSLSLVLPVVVNILRQTHEGIAGRIRQKPISHLSRLTLAVVFIVSHAMLHSSSPHLCQ